MSTKSVEAMAAVWDEAESTPDEAPAEGAETLAPEADAAPDVEAAAPDTEESAEEKAQRARDEAGRFAKEAKEAKSKAATKVAVTPKPRTGTGTPPPGTTPQAQAAAAGKAAQTPVAQAGPQATALRPPAGWKPAAREYWEKLPPEVQQEALRRDREAAVSQTKLAEAEKQLSGYNQELAPFQALIASSGAPAPKVVGSMLRVAHTLAYGPLPHKAQTLAHLIKSYGLATQDGIAALSAALDGQPPPQGGQAPQAQFDPNQLAHQVQQGVLQQLQQQRQQALYSQEAQALESWAQDKEFLDDVREEMADILEVAAKRGLKMTRDEAYSRACMLHPDIAPVLKQREAAKAASENAAKVQKAKAAASSVRGRPALGSQDGAQPQSRRDLIAAAYEDMNSR